MKLLRAYALACFLALQLLWPVQAYAFVPAMLGWLGAAALESAGPLLTWRVGAPLLGLGIGGGIAAAAEDRYPGIGKCLMVVALGKPGLCQPDGWSRNGDGTLAPPATATPGSTTVTYTWQICNTWWADCRYATEATRLDVDKAVCQAAGYIWYGWGQCRNGTYDGRYNHATSGTYNIAQPTCPAGYVASGSSCALSVPDNVLKPAGTPCQMVVTNGTLAYDSKNPGCPTAPPSSVTINGTKVNVSSDGKTVVLVGPDGSSAAISLGSGTASIVQNYPMTDDEGSPITQIGKTTLDTSTAIPKVKTQSIEYSKGQGDTTLDKPVVTPPLDCTMISNCNWANAQIQQQQLQVEQGIASTLSNIGSTIASAVTPVVQPLIDAVREIKDLVLPPSTPTTDLTTKPINNDSVPISIDDSDKFLGGTAQCPQPLQVQFNLGTELVTIPFSYQPLCLFASYMRPFFILTAYITAAFIIFRN